MMPSLILGLSALLLGAAGQSQYRPGGLSGNVDGSFSGVADSSQSGDYLDYQEQAQYRPGGSSDYEYENSITGGSLGVSGGSQTQQFEGSQNNDIQGQYGIQSGGDAFAIAGSTGNVGAGIHGDLGSTSGTSDPQGRPTNQFELNRPESVQGGSKGPGTSSTSSGGFSGNVGSGIPNNPESGSGRPTDAGGASSSTGSNSNNNQKQDDKSAWSLAEAIPGVAGDDYPVFTTVPETSFLCDGLVDGGYYADPEAECQAFHVCASDGKGGLAKYSFMCPNGTIFNQQVLVCDWWFNVDCSLTEELYSINVANAAEREANIGVGSTQRDVGNTANNGLQDSESQVPSKGQGNGNKNGQNQSLNSGDTRTKSNDHGSGLLSSVSDSTTNTQQRITNFNTGTGQKENDSSQNSREKVFTAGDRNSNQKGGYIAPGGSVSNDQSQGSGIFGSHDNSLSEGKPNDDFQLIQNGQSTGNGNSQEGFSGSASIQPLDIGYGAPGGQILGSYNYY